MANHGSSLHQRKKPTKDQSKTQAEKADSSKIEDQDSFTVRAVTEWFWEEGHDMTLAMVPNSIVSGTNQEKLKNPWIRYNPFYLGMFLFNAASVTGGRFVHTLFNQGVRVRKDETEVEHEVRVQWIYANDVLYCWSLIMDIITLASEIDLILFHKHLADGHDRVYSTLIAIVLLTLTVAGNVFFLHAMRKRHQNGVRAAIASNAGFAVILLLLMGYGLYKRAIKGTMWKLLHWHKFSSMVFRAMTIVFAWMAIPCYGKLWNAYGNQANEGLVVSVLVTLVPFIGMIALILGCYKLDSHALWETFG